MVSMSEFTMLSGELDRVCGAYWPSDLTGMVALYLWRPLLVNSLVDVYHARRWWLAVVDWVGDCRASLWTISSSPSPERLQSFDFRQRRKVRYLAPPGQWSVSGIAASDVHRDDFIDMLDRDGRWQIALVIKADERSLDLEWGRTVSHVNRETLERDSPLVAPAGTHTFQLDPLKTQRRLPVGICKGCCRCRSC
jgi:hypothetical protein